MIRKTNIFIILFSLVFFGIANGEEPQKPKEITVAIFDFKVGNDMQETVIDFGRERISRKVKQETSLLTNKLIAAIVNNTKINVIERERLDSVMKELTLTQGGFTDPANSKQIGKLLGADYLVHGAFSMFDAKIKYDNIPYTSGEYYNKTMEAQMTVDMRVVETETGKVVVAETVNEKNVKKEMVNDTREHEVPREFIEELQRKLVDSMVAKIKAIEKAPNAGATGK